jgi:uncharacterized damage-inducible protein DinB
MSAGLAKAVKSALAGELETLLAAVKELATPLSEAQFWARPIEPGNSFGHLVLHLTGNISHFVGAHLGDTGYVRDREREFNDPQPPPKAEALAKLEAAVALFRRVAEALPEDRFAEPFPEKDRGTVADMLVRVVAHFGLHRGQMSYIARMVTQPKG